MRILDRIKAHEHVRRGTLPMTPSESWLLPEARKALGTDLEGRYGHTFYGGNAEAATLLEDVRSLACRLFRCEHAFIEPLAGNIADLTVLHAFTEPGDGVAMVPQAQGGYPLGCHWFDRRRLDLAMTGHRNVDVASSREVLADASMTILGSSLFLFPHPVEETREAFDGPLVFDGAHVLGMIATGAFQDPLAEGADVLIGSTHKTLMGPQGGIVLTNDDEMAATIRPLLEPDMDQGIGLVDNPHPGRIAALGVVLEALLDRPDHGQRIRENSKALATALHEGGVPVAHEAVGFTESHQVLLAVEDTAGFKQQLEQAGILVDESGRVATGEVTWRGLGSEHMGTIAGLIARVHAGEDPKVVRDEVRALAMEHLDGGA